MTFSPPMNPFPYNPLCFPWSNGIFHRLDNSSMTSKPMLCLVLSYCLPGFPSPTNNFTFHTPNQTLIISFSCSFPLIQGYQKEHLFIMYMKTAKDVTLFRLRLVLLYSSLAFVSLPSSFSGSPGSCSSPELISSSTLGGRIETTTVFSSSLIS